MKSLCLINVNGVPEPIKSRVTKKVTRMGRFAAAVEARVFVARAVGRRHDQAARAPVGREGVVVPRLLVVPRDVVGRGHAWRVADHALARVLAVAAQGEEVGVQASGSSPSFKN